MKYAHMVSSFAFGFALGAVGFTFTTWQYWLLFSLLAAHGLISYMQGEKAGRQ